MVQSGSERRQWPRIAAEALSHITASVVAGPKVRLVNLSRGGALMEVASRFPMRSRVRLKLTVDSGEVTVAEGVVAWARVATIVDKQVNYLVAVTFDNAIPDLGGMDLPAAPEAATRVQTELPPEPSFPPVRDNLTQFPVPAARAAEPPVGVEAWDDSDEHVVPLDDHDQETAVRQQQASDQVAALSAAHDALVTQLTAATTACQALRGDLDTERALREEERRHAVKELAAARCALDELKSSVSQKEQDYAEALADQKAGYDALTHELLQANNDQQAEYQMLMDERTAWREEQRRRDDAYALEVARLREEGAQEREQLELRLLQLQQSLEASQSVAATLEARDRNLRRDLEIVLSSLAAAVGSGESPRGELLRDKEGHVNEKQAVA